ncbi:hypothetical protein SD208_16840 [Ochrobactrum sp. BD67]
MLARQFQSTPIDVKFLTAICSIMLSDIERMRMPICTFESQSNVTPEIETLLTKPRTSNRQVPFVRDLMIVPLAKAGELPMPMIV